ncbi:hypothetical protein FQN57_005106 [Myotisia sp. PD_48]|nr:hypothetical protein FQN57_005106 [Myotisia sp. PD_48]
MEMRPSQAVHGRIKRATPPPGPFGYSVISPQDAPYGSAPDPPPGPALLNDNDTSMLENFFTSLNASHLDGDDFWLSFGDQGNGDFGMGLDWPDLPPNFEGSSTSLPPRSFAPWSSRETIVSDRHRGLGSDVLAAAQMLYQNGLNTNDFMSTFNNQIYTENGMLDMSGHDPEVKRVLNGYSGENGDSRASHPHSHYGVSHKPIQYTDKGGIHANKMIFDPEAQVAPHTADQYNVKLGALQWGSDSRFADQGYRHPDAASAEEYAESLVRNLERLEGQSSASNTRPASPITTGKAERNSSTFKSSALKPPNAYDETLIKGPTPYDNERPQKRRKSNNKIKEEDAELQNALEHNTFSRSTTSASNTSRKSKGAVSGGKPLRENLSEAQKRSNHILSEQKRRNLIKQGFDDLCALVPELKGGGYSKSTMLTQAGDWLQDLLSGNELLKAQLAEIKAHTGE